MGSQRWVKISIRTQTAMLCVQRVTEGTQSTGQVETVVGSSLAPVTSLLVPPTGPTDPVLHHGGLTGSAISLQ